jgi:hypothetical protein
MSSRWDIHRYLCTSIVGPTAHLTANLAATPVNTTSLRGNSASWGLEVEKTGRLSLADGSHYQDARRSSATACRDSLDRSVAKVEYPRYCQREGKRKPSVSAAPAMTQHKRAKGSEVESGTRTR